MKKANTNKAKKPVVKKTKPKEVTVEEKDDSHLAPIGRHIVKLQIINFQDHKNTIINFKPGMNLLVGSSDSGKSAILRALNFIFHNIPNKGKDFVRFGSTECTITVWFN